MDFAAARQWRWPLAQMAFEKEIRRPNWDPEYAQKPTARSRAGSVARRSLRNPALCQLEFHNRKKAGDLSVIKPIKFTQEVCQQL